MSRPRTRPAAVRLDAAPLIAEIEAYCEATDTDPGQLGRVALAHSGYVGLIRRRGKMSSEAAASVRAAIARYPQGINRLTPRLGFAPAASRGGDEALSAIAERRAQMEARPRVARDPCPRCGTRGDIGCEHSKGRIGTSYG